MRGVSTAGDILEIAIRLEQAGRSLYETLAKSTKDTRIWDAYTYLADQEAIHERVFTSLYQQIGAAGLGQLPPERQEIIQELVDATLPENRYEAALKKEARSDSDAIEIGTRFEEDTIRMYTQLREFVQEPDRAIVDRVIDEERSHLRLLTDIRKETGL